MAGGGCPAEGVGGQGVAGFDVGGDDGWVLASARGPRLHVMGDWGPLDLGDAGGFEAFGLREGEVGGMGV